MSAAAASIESTRELSALESAIEKGHILRPDGAAQGTNYRPIILAMKPCEGTFAENALKWGVAGLNVDGGRIGTTRDVPASLSKNKTPNSIYGEYGSGNEKELNPNVGRWPANLLLDEEAGVMLDEQSGQSRSVTRVSEDVDAPKSTYALGRTGITPRGHTDAGGASRFFYVAKASRAERGEDNKHPTVKPIKLAEYLARLILPPKRSSFRCLVVPFCGSGSEVIGALRAGWDEVIGIDNDPQWCEIARQRIKAEK